MLRWLWILAAVAWPATASAEKVVVYSTAGPGGGKIGKVLLKVLKTQLASHQVLKKRRPRKWKRARGKLAAAVGKAAAKGKAAIGVDSQVIKKGGRTLVVLAVDTEGGIVLEESLALPGNKKEARDAIMGLGRRLASEINGRLGTPDGAEAEPPPPAEESMPQPEPTVAEFEEEEPIEKSEPIAPLLDEQALAADPPPQEEPPPPPPENVEPVDIDNPDFLAGPVDLDEAAMVQLDATEKKRRRVRVGTRSIHFTARAGVGAAGYDDRIRTTVAGGDLVRDVTATLHTGIGFELEVHRWLELTIDGRRNAAKMRLQGATGANVVKVSELGATGQLGATFDLGPVRAGVRAGAAFDVSSVGDSFGGLTLPGWNRLLVLAGLVLGYGAHGDDGIAVQLGALYAPWGTYSEDPVTSGKSPSFKGGLAWLRVRYQLPILFGSKSGGLFFEVAGSGEYLLLGFTGLGTRTAPISGEQVSNAEQTRLGWTGAASVGYVY